MFPVNYTSFSSFIILLVLVHNRSWDNVKRQQSEWVEYNPLSKNTAYKIVSIIMNRQNTSRTSLSRLHSTRYLASTYVFGKRQLIY